MKVAIMGSGGVGGYYGGRLAQTGHDVAFLARGAHGKAMSESGLRIESPLGSAIIHPISVFEDPKLVGPVDLVLVAVKLWDALATARLIRPLVSDSTVVISLQNGIDKDDILASAVGREHVLGGVTYINALITAPGTITQIGTLQRLVVGGLASRSKRCETIAAALVGAGVDVEVSSDIRRAIWEKFIFLTAYSGLTALLRLPIGPIRTHPLTRKMIADAMHEGVLVATAAGITIPEDFIPRQLAFIDALPEQAAASMATDLQRGNRLELERLSGAVVRWAERLGIQVPIHRAIEAALILYASGS